MRTTSDDVTSQIVELRKLLEPEQYAIMKPWLTNCQSEQNQVSTGDNTGKSTSGQRSYMAMLEGEQQNSGHSNKKGKMVILVKPIE